MNFPPPTGRQARVIWFALTALAVTCTIAIVGAIVWGLGHGVMAISPVLWPIAVAGVVAIILDPLVEWLVARRVPRWRAILLVFGAAGFLALSVLGSVLPRAILEARDLAGRIPTYVEVAHKRLEDFLASPPAPLLRLLPEAWRKELEGRGAGGGSRTNSPAAGGPSTASTAPPVGGDSPTNAAAGPAGRAEAMDSSLKVPLAKADSPWWLKAIDPRALKTAGGWLGTVVPEVAGWLLGQVGKVASWVGVLAGLALIPVYAFYFLLEKSSIERRWTDYLPVANSWYKDELVWLLRNINDALIVFFRGQVLVAICDGFLYAVGFVLIGLPYGLLLGLVATVLTVIPFLGATITCVMALIIAVIQFGDWQHPLLVLGVFLVVQTVEGWVIQPKIIGDRVGLHPVTIIIALLIGTTLMGGILGGLLAIPATAVLRALMFRYVWRAGRSGGVSGGEGGGGEAKGAGPANHSEKTV